MPEWLISMLTGLAMGTATGGISWGANANLNKKNRQWQEQMYERQLQDNEEFYLNYQSPSAIMSQQMEGFRQNGINPAMMFGHTPTQGQQRQQTSIPTPNSHGYDFLSHIFDTNIYQQSKEIEQLSANIKYTEQQIEESKSRQTLNNMESLLARGESLQVFLKNQFDIATFDTSVNKYLVNFATDVEKYFQEHMNTEVQKRTKESLISSLNLDYDIKQKQKSFIEKQIELIGEDINVRKSQQGYLDASARMMIAQAAAVEFSNTLNTKYKDKISENFESELSLREEMLAYGEEFKKKHGINPLYMDEFQIMLSAAFDELEGVDFDIQSFLNGKNPNHWTQWTKGILNSVINVGGMIGGALIMSRMRVPMATGAIAPVTSSPSYYQDAYPFEVLH